MKSALALFLGFAFIGWMLQRDRRWRRLPSAALWIPGIWTALAGSRQISFWLAQIGIGGEQTSRLEGSPVNMVFNGSLLLAAIFVLNRRRFGWRQFARSNKALCATYAFFLLSVLWSPFPLPTAKRVVLDFGCVLTALVILTEKDPAASLRVVFVRVSYILFPLSVIFMRYFPDIGRVYSSVSGTQMPCGVTGHKNLLGQMTLVFCLVLVWDLMETWKCKTPARGERWVRLANLGIGLYLLVISSSATSGMTFLLGLALLFAGKRLAHTRSAGRLFMAGALAVVVLFTADQMAGISSWLSESLGRGAGLSGRKDIWRVTLEKYAGSPLVGAGFRAFWETSEGESVWKELGTNPLVQSHNGYLETYLNGGFVGLSLLGALLWASGRNATDKLVRGNPVGRLAVVFWPILLMVNVTEAQFFQISSLWFTTLLVVIGSPWQDRGEVEGEHWRRGGDRSAATRSARWSARGPVRRGSLPRSSQGGTNEGSRTVRPQGNFHERE